MIKFIIITYTAGPMAAIAYAIQVLNMTSLQALIAVSMLNIILIPIFFKAFEFGGRHRELYRLKIFRKVAEASNEKMEEIRREGDQIIALFEERLGHLGFYMAIVLFTLIFGVMWASLLSYILLVKRKRAIVCMALGVVLGNVFWLYLASYAMNYITPVGFIVIALSIPILMYGSQREKGVILDVSKRMRLGKHKIRAG